MTSGSRAAQPEHLGIAVEAVEHHGHAGVLEDLHAGAVGALQHVGGEDLTGRALADHLGVEADEVGQVGGHAVEVVGA